MEGGGRWKVEGGSGGKQQPPSKMSVRIHSHWRVVGGGGKYREQPPSKTSVCARVRGWWKMVVVMALWQLSPSSSLLAAAAAAVIAVLVLIGSGSWLLSMCHCSCSYSCCRHWHRCCPYSAICVVHVETCSCHVAVRKRKKKKDHRCTFAPTVLVVSFHVCVVVRG